MAGHEVRLAVEELRKKLLDLTMRNRMLNYRPHKHLGLAVVGENTHYIHKLLVEDGKKMSFVGRPDPPRRAVQERSGSDEPGQGTRLDAEDDVTMAAYREAAEDELNAYLENSAVPVDQLDTKLNTEEIESTLQAKLRRIQREASLVNEELGVHTLFLTLGMLEWRETPERSYRAPLLFIPVQLERQANGSLRLLYEGSDVGGNLPLRAKLLEFNLSLPEWDEEKGVSDYLSAVASTVRKREDWAVHPDEVALGFFNYEKYAMYVDLGGEAWPEGRKPWENPDLRAMLGGGYGSAESRVSDDTDLDTLRSVIETREVFDADGSQTVAMIRAAEGLSIVVEGPPGTGKSQTITNIIAEAVAAGKSVLFVSAKRAALEVVKRRLTEADLGPICLDLHDKLTNRREFYAEIKRTMGRSLNLQREDERIQRLGALRERLNAHSRAVNEPMPEFGCPPFAAMAALAHLPPERPEDMAGRLPFDKLRHWTVADLRAARPIVEALRLRVQEIGVPQTHPFWGAEISYLDPATRLDLQEGVSEADAALSDALAAWARACAALQVTLPPTAENARVLRLCAERAFSAPVLDGVALKAATWREDASAVREVAAALRSWRTLRDKRQGQVSPEIWDADVREVERAYAQYGPKWYRFMAGPFRRAQAALSPYLLPGAPPAASARHELLSDVQNAQMLETQVQAHAEGMRRLFGVQWQGTHTDPSVLERLLEWVLALRDDVTSGTLPAGLLDFLSASHGDGAAIRVPVETAEAAAKGATERYVKLADGLRYPHPNLAHEDWTVTQARVRRWTEALSRLPSYIAYTEARRQALDHGLEPVVQLADAWPLAGERLTDALWRSYYTGVVREAMQRRPELRSFERAGHEAAIAEFRGLDDFKLRYNGRRSNWPTDVACPPSRTPPATCNSSGFSAN